VPARGVASPATRLAIDGDRQIGSAGCGSAVGASLDGVRFAASARASPRIAGRGRSSVVRRTGAPGTEAERASTGRSTLGVRVIPGVLAPRGGAKSPVGMRRGGGADAIGGGHIGGGVGASRRTTGAGSTRGAGFALGEGYALEKTSWSTSRSTSRSSGLSRYATTPCFAVIRSRCIAERYTPLITRIGIVAPRARSRMRAMSSKPLSFGTSTSTRRRSTGRASKVWRPDSPSRSSSTWNPSAARTSSSQRATDLSSSTTRIVLVIDGGAPRLGCSIGPEPRYPKGGARGGRARCPLDARPIVAGRRLRGASGPGARPLDTDARAWPDRRPSSPPRATGGTGA
jgi:hypothetical protein